MSIFGPDFWQKAEQAVRVLDAQPEQAAIVQGEVDEFFAKYPKLHRTRTAEAFVASLVIERLSTPADSQSAQPNAETQKVA